MKKLFCIIFLLTITLSLSAQEIKRLSTFTVWGMVELREEQGFEESVKYKTLNHENGLKVRALEIGSKEIFINEFNEQLEGIWIKVINTAPVWSECWNFIQRGNEFWIFISDETLISDYRE